MHKYIIKTKRYVFFGAEAFPRTPRWVAQSGADSQTVLEPRVEGVIIGGNKTRQGYVLRNTLKQAGYFFLASQKLLRPVL